MKLTIKNFKVQPRQYGAAGGRGWRSYYSAPRLYISHANESILENFGNRAARPVKLYKEILEEVRKLAKLPATAAFRWNQKAGCSCGCSPGFVVQNVPGNRVGDHYADIFVTVDGGEKMDPSKKDIVENRQIQLLADPTIRGALEKTAKQPCGHPNVRDIQ